MTDVVADGLLADGEPAGDLLVRLPDRQQLEDLDLARRQAVVELFRRRGPSEHVEDAVRDRVRHHAFTADHGQDAGNDGVRLRVLQYIAAGPGPQRLQDV